MKKYRIIKMAGLLGILLSLAFAASAQAYGIDQSTVPKSCTAPCSIAVHFIADPGQTYDLHWDTDWNSSFKEKARTTCSDTMPAGCDMAVTYNTVGRHQVLLEVNGETDGVVVDVVKAQDLPAPIHVYTPLGSDGKPRPLNLPGDLIYVGTTKPEATFGWNSSRTNQEGGGAAKFVGVANGERIFAYQLYAPPGPITFFVTARSATGSDDFVTVNRSVASFNGGTYSGFTAAINRVTFSRSKLVVKSQFDFRALKAVPWSVVTTARTRVRGHLMTVKKVQRGHSTTATRRYDINQYWPKVSITGSTARAITSAACSHSTRVSVTFLVGTKGNIWKSHRSTKIKPRHC